MNQQSESEHVTEMLTVDQLMGRAINAEAAKEAHAQSEKLLADLLETKKSFETRASSLLTGFTAFALALAGAAGSFFTNAELIKMESRYLPILLFLSCIPLIIAAWHMVTVLQPSRYGTLGSAGSEWLLPQLIDAKVNVLPHVHAVLTRQMFDRIEATVKSNDKKAEAIWIGTSAALASPIILIIGVIARLASLDG